MEEGKEEEMIHIALFKDKAIRRVCYAKR